MLTRRLFTGFLGGLLALPAFIRSGVLMPVKTPAFVGVPETILPCAPDDMPECGWGRLPDGRVIAWGKTTTSKIDFPVKFNGAPGIRMDGRIWAGGPDDPPEAAARQVLAKIEAGQRVGWTALGRLA